jgi:hypothetical protein
LANKAQDLGVGISEKMLELARLNVKFTEIVESNMVGFVSAKVGIGDLIKSIL